MERLFFLWLVLPQTGHNFGRRDALAAMTLITLMGKFLEQER
jgi:hypothetical protein